MSNQPSCRFSCKQAPSAAPFGGNTQYRIIHDSSVKQSQEQSWGRMPSEFGFTENSLASITPDFVKRLLRSLDYPLSPWLLAKRCDSARVGILHYAPAWTVFRISQFDFDCRCDIHSPQGGSIAAARLADDSRRLVTEETTRPVRFGLPCQCDPRACCALGYRQMTSNAVCSSKGLGS